MMPIADEYQKVFEKFEFEVQPVGVKFLTRKPDGIERLEGNMALCEMLKKAQDGHMFFVDAGNHTCGAGSYVLGQSDASKSYINGEFGAGLKIFNGTRTASRLYLHLPKIERGVVDYLAFAPLDKLTFGPDLLIILAESGQTEILLRAMSYGTGMLWVSKFTPAIGCAWTYVYPYLTGELNYFVTGLGHGMKRRGLFAEGKQIISIPFDLLSPIMKSLEEMSWVLPAYKPDGLDFVKRLQADLDLGTRRPGDLKGKVEIKDDFDKLPDNIAESFGVKES